MKKLILLPALFFYFTSNAQVNLQTGSAVFDIPIFDWQDTKSNLNFLINLNYNSGNGLKVDEIASNVGQGWNLIKGGVISRIQIEEPDDQKPREGIFSDLTKYPPGFLYNPKNPSDGCPNALSKYPIFSGVNMPYLNHNSVVADREQDRFLFQFNGRSGEFILGKNNGDKGILLGSSRLKIWFERQEMVGLRTTISSFYIQDENGLIYYFHELGKSAVLEETGTVHSYEHQAVYHHKMETTGDHVVNNWYLSEIQDPVTGRKVKLNYWQSADILNRGSTSIALLSTPYNIDPDLVAGGTTFGMATKKSIVVTQQLVSAAVNGLSSIEFPDGHRVEFEYSGTRQDWQNGEILKNILIKFNGINISKYELKHGYFTARSGIFPENVELGDKKKEARLCLTSVQKYGADLTLKEPPYIFDYYTGTGVGDNIVPPLFHYVKDIWGYYNGDYSYLVREGDLPMEIDYQPITIPLQGNVDELDYRQLFLLCFKPLNPTQIVIKPKPGYAKNGLLKSIRYPLGAKLTYEYEQNNGNLPGIGYTNVGGVSVSKIISEPDATERTVGELAPQTITKYNYILDDGKSSMWGIEMPDNKTKSITYYSRAGEHNGIYGCSYDYIYPGIYNSRKASQSANKGPGFWQAYSVFGKFQDVKTVINSIIQNNFGPVIIIAYQLIVGYISSCDNADHYTYTETFSNSNLNDINPLPAQYKRVEVIENPSENNGKIIYEFTSDTDYPLWLPQNPDLSMQQRYAPWAYGLLKNTSIIDAAGKIISTTSNSYNNPIVETIPQGLSCQCKVKQAWSQGSEDWNNPTIYDASSSYFNSSNGDVLVNKYEYKTGRTEISNSIEKVFKEENVLRKSTNYFFNPINYKINLTSSIQSNGDKNVVETYYPEDYNLATGPIANLINSNQVNVPVAVYSSIIKQGEEQKKYLSGSVTEFTTLGNGQVKPLKNYTGIPDIPTIGFLFDPVNQFNFPFLEVDAQSTYDAQSGSLVMQKDIGGRVASYIYDHDERFVIATIINADLAIDMPAYTSFETKNLGGWALSGNEVRHIKGVTGVNAFALSQGANSLSAPLNINKAYKVSLWTQELIKVKADGILINPQITGPEVNGFVYCEYEIPVGTTSVNLSGNSDIDELRLYPKNARMKTAAYSPVNVKTAECDENNQIIYYEYDALRRPVVIKNMKGEVIKAYDYHYNELLFPH